MIYKIRDIFDKLENCIEYKLPFSHIRFGDGGLKLIHALVAGDDEQLKIIMKKEGLPKEGLISIFELWGLYARKADFIDTPEVYYNGMCWPRVKKPGKEINSETDEKLRDWQTLYSCAEFDNDNHCNPESNCLMILKRDGQRNLFDIIKGRKVCLITARPEIKAILPEVDIIEIVGQWEDQYTNSFKKVVKFIKATARKYDCFLVAAGELGRIYSGLIKEYGGRSLDIGFVVEYLLDGELHPRFHVFINMCLNNRFELVLTNEGKKYEQFI